MTIDWLIDPAEIAFASQLTKSEFFFLIRWGGISYRVEYVISNIEVQFTAETGRVEEISAEGGYTVDFG